MLLWSGAESPENSLVLERDWPLATKISRVLYQGLFVFGDELLALIADELSVGAALNRVTYRQQVYHAEAQQTYQSAYNSKARRAAKDMGQHHGENWRPGDHRRNSQK